MSCLCLISFFFFFNDTATTEIYTLSLHDALPIFLLDISDLLVLLSEAFAPRFLAVWIFFLFGIFLFRRDFRLHRDRKSTRLNSSHGYISYAVFCLKKKHTQLRTAVTRFATAPCRP